MKRSQTCGYISYNYIYIKCNDRKKTKFCLGEKRLRTKKKVWQKWNFRLMEWLRRFSGVVSINCAHLTALYPYIHSYFVVFIDQGYFLKTELIRSQVTKCVIQKFHFLTLHSFCFHSKLLWWTAGTGLPCWKKDYEVIYIATCSLSQGYRETSNEITGEKVLRWESSSVVVKYNTTIYNTYSKSKFYSH